MRRRVSDQSYQSHMPRESPPLQRAEKVHEHASSFDIVVATSARVQRIRDVSILWLPFGLLGHVCHVHEAFELGSSAFDAAAFFEVEFMDEPLFEAIDFFPGSRFRVLKMTNDED
jgi:hypothetical protein